MAYNELRTLINAYIKHNGRQEITGNVLNGVLNAMVGALGEDGLVFKGRALPTTDPGTPKTDVAYLAGTAGTYTHFGEISVGDYELALLVYDFDNEAWSKETIIIVGGDSPVFVAEYGSTSYQEVEDAVNHDKIVFAWMQNADGMFLPLTSFDDENYIYFFSNSFGDDRVFFALENDDTWTNGTGTYGLEKVSNKVATLPETGSNTKYTAVQAVRTYIGLLSNLQTTDKSSIVNAINELVNATPAIPVTDVTLGGTSVLDGTIAKLPAYPDISNLATKDELSSLGNGKYVMAWDGASTPVIADIPAGVSVTYNGVTYTGTMTASASTDGNVYLVSAGSGDYDRYVSTEVGGVYSWINLGTTAIPLQDYATKSEVSQLEAEVTDIDDTINGKQIVDKSDTVGTLLNQYISATHNSQEGVAYSNYNLYKATDYLPVVGGSTIMISVFGTNSSAGDAGIAFYDSNKAVIPNTGIKYLNESAVNNDTRTIVVPSGASYLRTTIERNIGTSVVFKVVVQGESYEERISKLESETDALSAENAELKSSLISLDTELINLDDKSIVSVDLMQMVHAMNNMSSLDYMEVLSASESSITLSSEDAQKFPTSPTYGTVAVVGFSNGEYKVVYFGSPSGTTIPRSSFETTDLTNATRVQSLHDTLPGANGQHLSASGYIAMGKFVADEIQRQASMIDKNWLGGLVFNKLGPSKGYQNTDENNAVYDLDDNVVCRPEFYNWMWGGYTPNGNNVSNDRGVSNSSYNALANGWVQKAYAFIQGKKDAYIEFPIELSGTGFVEVQAAKKMRYSTSNGGCRIDVFADGENVGSYELTLNQTRYKFDNVTVSKKLCVRFTLLNNADTEVVIYSIGMWKMYSGVTAPGISSFTKIAVLGDSWTQFPGVGSGLSDHSSWNDVITRPDGTNGDGYGYFTRELSRYTGASVDNWGKANMTAENWGLVKIDEVLNHAFYDYLIVEFFINDINAGTQLSAWISNIKAICNKCKRAGTRPVFIMPCGTNSFSQATSLGIWHEAVLEGLGKK